MHHRNNIIRVSFPRIHIWYKITNVSVRKLCQLPQSFIWLWYLPRHFRGAWSWLSTQWGWQAQLSRSVRRTAKAPGWMVSPILALLRMYMTINRTTASLWWTTQLARKRLWLMTLLFHLETRLRANSTMDVIFRYGMTPSIKSISSETSRLALESSRRWTQGRPCSNPTCSSTLAMSTSLFKCNHRMLRNLVSPTILWGLSISEYQAQAKNSSSAKVKCKMVRKR